MTFSLSTSWSAPLSIAALLATGCGGGPTLKFDPAPAPSWTSESPTEVGARTLRAVGAAPATTQVTRDVELATRDAKTQVAQMFESQVAARSSDWTLASYGGAEESERTVAAQSVDVRSNVKVEDVSVDSKYRDEATKTQYVRVTVDRSAWVNRLRGRLADGFGEIESKLAAATSAVDAKRPMVALEELIAAYGKGGEMEPDIVVLDLLAKQLGVRAKLLDLKKQMDALSRKLRHDYHFVVAVKCTDKQIAKKLVGNVEEFLNGFGFKVGKGRGGAMKIKVTVGQQFVKSEQVADRTEFIHAGVGSLKVFDADGSEITALGVRVEAGRYEERDVDKKAAVQKALVLAADTLTAKFRSAFRNAYEVGE